MAAHHGIMMTPLIDVEGELDKINVNMLILILLCFIWGSTSMVQSYLIIAAIGGSGCDCNSNHTK